MSAAQHARHRGLAVVAALTFFGLLAACGVPQDSSFIRIESDKIPFGLAATTTTSTTTTSTTSPVVEVTTVTLAPPPILTTKVNLYFVANRQLVAVTQELPAPTSVAQVLSILEGGTPAGGISAGLRTAIPAGVLSIAAQSRGVVNLDLPANFFDTMQPQDQRLAIAQYVLTVTELSGVGQVSFSQAGVPIAVVGGGGEAIDPGQALVHEDFERLLVTGAETPTTTTTTIAATTTLPATTTSFELFPQSTGP